MVAPRLSGTFPFRFPSRFQSEKSHDEGITQEGREATAEHNSRPKPLDEHGSPVYGALVCRSVSVDNHLCALEAGLEKRGSGLPGFCRRVGAIAFHPLFIAKRMGSIGVGPDLHALLMLSRSST